MRRRTLPEPVPLTSMRTRLMALVCALLALSGCGASAPEDPLAPWRAQTLTWQACDPDSPTGQGEDSPGTWADDQQALGERLQCARVRVPVDYAHPERGELSVGVLRITAAKPQARRGALFFNPGGPGADGLQTPFRLYQVFSRSNSAHPLGALQLRLLDEYDLIGFSPRGTGASTRLECRSDAQERPIDLGPLGHLDPDYWETVQHNLNAQVAACQTNPLTPDIHTEATARDLDLLRELAGESQLNYIGYSYGTWLGTWYASLFPQRVGRMLLDGNMDFTRSFDQLLIGQPPAQQRALDDLLAPYAARHANIFNLGSTPAQVRALPAAWSPRLQSAVAASSLPMQLYNRETADDALLTIGAAQGLHQVLQALPEDASPPLVLKALQAHRFSPGNQGAETVMQNFALHLYASMLQVPEPEPGIALGTYASVTLAVRCNDTPTEMSDAFWHDLSERYASLYPLLGSNIDTMSCRTWGGPRVQRPALAAMAGLQVLMLQAEFDGATPAQGAMRSFDALPGAHMLYVPGELQHALYPYEDECLDLIATRYLLGETPAQRFLTCPARPLRFDAVAAKAQTTRPGVYRDSTQAHALIGAFKRHLVGSSR